MQCTEDLEKECLPEIIECEKLIEWNEYLEKLYSVKERFYGFENLHSHKYVNQFLYECKKAEIDNSIEMKHNIYIKVNYRRWL